MDRALEIAGYTLPASIGAGASGRAELRLRPGVDDPLSRLAADASVSLQPIGHASRRGASWPSRASPTPPEGRLVVRRHTLTAQPSAASPAGTLTGRIHQGRNDSTLGGSARLRIDDLDGGRAAGDAGVSIPEQYCRDLRGSLDARLTPGGTITRPTVRATLTRDVRAADWPTTSVDATLSVDRGGLRVHRLDARADLARLSASGDYSWSGRGTSSSASRSPTSVISPAGSRRRPRCRGAHNRRPRGGNGRSTARAGDADSRRGRNRRNGHRTRRRHDSRSTAHEHRSMRTRRPRCAGSNGSGHRPPLQLQRRGPLRSDADPRGHSRQSAESMGDERGRHHRQRASSRHR